jgi:hypothetical protein
LTTILGDALLYLQVNKLFSKDNIPPSNYACNKMRPPARCLPLPRVDPLLGPPPPTAIISSRHCTPITLSIPSTRRDVIARHHLPCRADPLVSEPASKCDDGEGDAMGFQSGPGRLPVHPPLAALGAVWYSVVGFTERGEITHVVTEAATWHPYS